MLFKPGCGSTQQTETKKQNEKSENSGNSNNVEKQQNVSDDAGMTNAGMANSDMANPGNEEDREENYITNMSMIPYKVDSFCGCDVVMNEDQVIEELQKNNDDCLEEFNHVPVIKEPVELIQEFAA